ncbi:MAG: UDP-3-O-(3-hydroxymyristoyl)glucosamine N-acyltransferase [Bacteroidetes bacterium]|nr:UDP-3-O-(3-hydroxymyristoyl)glucosamine N-acyltransferase [Bacteroidota bacterium]
MEFTAAQIAKILNAEIQGDPEIKVDRLSKIEEGEPGSLSFLANPKYTPCVYTTLASVIIVNKDFETEKEIKPTLLRVDNAYAAFSTLLEFYNKETKTRKGISSMAFIHESVILGEDVYVGEFVSLGENVTVGKGVKIYPNTTIGDNVVLADGVIIYSGVNIYRDCLIGPNCIIHSGAVIGSDGFGFVPGDEFYTKIPQTGNVILEENVEIGANTTIDRATLGSTILRKGVKLDNLIQIGHNCEIGENTVIASQAGVSGSTKIGRNCMIGGQVGFVGHITIADNTKFAGQTGVEYSIKKEGAVMMGSPALEIGHYQRSFIHFKNFQQIVRRLDEVERILAEKLK